eukprot:Pompholyxophrys_punicea_v1_NODE_1_length_14747_cov_12.267901.p13 type:complete len:112 gc:universal NODE_1_length_14747_cov_12.267901:1344-1009(-)
MLEKKYRIFSFFSFIGARCRVSSKKSIKVENRADTMLLFSLLSLVFIRDAVTLPIATAPAPVVMRGPHLVVAPHVVPRTPAEKAAMDVANAAKAASDFATNLGFGNGLFGL